MGYTYLSTMPATYVVDDCCRRRCGLWAGCNRAPGRIHCVCSAGSVLGALKLRHRRLHWALWLSSNFVLALSGANESKRVVVIHLVAAVKLIFVVCFSLFIGIRRARKPSPFSEDHTRTPRGLRFVLVVVPSEHPRVWATT